MINHISKPFKWFFKLEAASGLVLLFSAVLALIISNSTYSTYYFGYLEKYIFIGFNEIGLKLSVLHWINDALMAVFFFFVFEILSTPAFVLESLKKTSPSCNFAATQYVI